MGAAMRMMSNLLNHDIILQFETILEEYKLSYWATIIFADKRQLNLLFKKAYSKTRFDFLLKFYNFQKTGESSSEKELSSF